jgi:hypothetical protein
LPESFATPTVREADGERKRDLEALLRQHHGNVSQVATPGVRSDAPAWCWWLRWSRVRVAPRSRGRER